MGEQTAQLEKHMLPDNLKQCEYEMSIHGELENELANRILSINQVLEIFILGYYFHVKVLSLIIFSAIRFW